MAASSTISRRQALIQEAAVVEALAKQRTRKIMTLLAPRAPRTSATNRMEDGVEEAEVIAAKATAAEAEVVVATTVAAGEAKETTITTKVAVVAINHLATGVAAATNPPVAIVVEAVEVAAATTGRPATPWLTYVTRSGIRQQLSSSETDYPLSASPSTSDVPGDSYSSRLKRK